MPGNTRPVLQTPRLTLRPFTMNDAPAVQRLAGDRDIASTTLSIPHPYDLATAEEWIAIQEPAFDAGALVNFAITDRENGELVGATGLVVTTAHARAELGYWIGKPYWGRGYATEAAAAVVQYGFDVLHLARIQATHFTRNPASGRVMEKIGMTREGILRHYIRKWDVAEDVVIYAVVGK